MGEIINLHDFLLNKTFQSQVISFFENIHFPFQYFKDDKEAVFILKPESYLVIFIKFIHKNEYTELPTLEESLYNIQASPRNSKGEWVVDKIFEVPEKHGKQLFHLIHRNKENVYPYLKKVFNK